MYNVDLVGYPESYCLFAQSTLYCTECLNKWINFWEDTEFSEEFSSSRQWKPFASQEILPSQIIIPLHPEITVG